MQRSAQAGVSGAATMLCGYSVLKWATTAGPAVLPAGIFHSSSEYALWHFESRRAVQTCGSSVHSESESATKGFNSSESTSFRDVFVYVEWFIYMYLFRATNTIVWKKNGSNFKLLIIITAWAHYLEFVVLDCVVCEVFLLFCPSLDLVANFIRLVFCASQKLNLIRYLYLCIV